MRPFDSSVLAVLLLVGLVDAMDGCDNNKRHYKGHPECNPASLQSENVKCSDLPPPVPIGGGAHIGRELLYNVINSRGYAARFAEALGAQCATNATMLKELRLMASWSGLFGSRSAESGKEFDLMFHKRCTFPTKDFPFLCEGFPGNPGTCGTALGKLSYTSVAHDDVNHRWTAFAVCWNGPTPENPNAVATRTDFNVYAMDPVLTCKDRSRILTTFGGLGFNVQSDNIIEPDYVTLEGDMPPPTPNCLP